jgi:integrase
MESRFKFKFRLDKRRKLDDGTYPIKVNIHTVSSNTNRDFSLSTRLQKFNCSERDFKDIWTNRFKYDSFGDVSGETTVLGSKLELRTKLKVVYDRLIDVIERNDVHTYLDVKKALANYSPAKKKNTDFISIDLAFKNYINELEGRSRFKTATSYRTTYNNIKNFDPGLKYLRYITTQWLKDFDRTRRNNVSASTVGVDTRNIRAVWNANIDIKDAYPFGKGKYTPPTGQAKNQGLEIKDLKKILNFQTENLFHQEARDFFIFSYYAGGMNFKDIALLEKNQVEFIRAKTRFTAKKVVKVKLELNEHQLEIVSRRKGKKYLFNLLDGITDPKEIQSKISNTVQRISQRLKEIAKLLDIDFPVSYNWARHSFATKLYESNVTMKSISESMGHTDVKTTMGYLDTLIDKEKSKIDDALNLD